MKSILYMVVLVVRGWNCEGARETVIHDQLPLNTHPYSRENFYSRFLQRLEEPTSTKGPVLFPPSPDPPRLPLVVTARPLAEQIAKSNLFDEENINSTIERIQQYDPITIINSRKPKIGINVDLHKHNLDPAVNREVDLPENEIRALGIKGTSYKQATERPISFFGGIKSGIDYIRNSFNQEDKINEVNNLKIGSEDRFNLREQIRTTLRPFLNNDGNSRPAASSRPIFGRPIWRPAPNRPLSESESNQQSFYSASDRPEDIVDITPKTRYLSYNKPYADYPTNTISYDIRNHYDNQEQKIVPLPQIYKAISQHADEQLQSIQKPKLKPIYEEQKTVPLPQIYKAISKHADQQLQSIQQSKLKPIYEEEEGDDDYYNDMETSSESDVLGRNYAFAYAVRDKDHGDDFSHRQQSTGQATKGEYRVKLPDGRTQIVSYTADENGYNADVRYDDETTKNTISNDETYPRYKPRTYPADKNGYNANVRYDDETTKNTISNDETYPRYKPRTNNYIDRNDDAKSDTDIGAESYAELRTAIENKNAEANKPTAEQKDVDYDSYDVKTTADYDYYNDDLARNKYDYNEPIVINAKSPTPIYEEEKTIFVTPTKTTYNRYLYNKIPVQYDVPSTTAIPYYYSSSSDSSYQSTSSKSSESYAISTSEPSFLYSTLPPLIRQNLNKPGFQEYVNKINRYLKLA